MRTYEERKENILDKAKKQRRKKRAALISALSVVGVFLLSVTLYLFVPYTVGGINLSLYRENEYYSVIKELSPLTYGMPTTTTNAKELFSYTTSGDLADAPAADAPMPGAGGSESANRPNGSYEEVTNNQTNGVIEGDLLKRSSKYFFYLNLSNFERKVNNGVTVILPMHYELEIYSIAKENSAIVATYDIFPEEGHSFDGFMSSMRELFLSEDCNTVTVVSPSYVHGSGQLYTALINIDVSDVNNIRETGRCYISGNYVSARLKEESFLLISNYQVKLQPDFNKAEDYIPHVGTTGNMQPLPLDNIVLPTEATSTQYTVVCSLNASTLAVNSCIALLSYSEEAYIAEENLYVTRQYWKISSSASDSNNSSASDSNVEIGTSATEIVGICYASQSLTVIGSFHVDGTLNNRYCMDEYEGVLRVFTTVTAPFSTTLVTDKGPVIYTTFHNSASLFCFDVATKTLIASVERFAPKDESVKSARFDGEKAYVCTAFVNYNLTIINDPVYAFDLSDYQAITSTDTGTIPGYSLSLYRFTEDTLIGIGYGDGFETLKIEIYREREGKVESVAKYESENTFFSQEFKAYLLDRESGLVGLSINRFGNGENALYGYLLLRYDGYRLAETRAVPMEQNFNSDMTRAVCIGGYVYIFNEKNSHAVTSLTVIKL